MGQIHELMPLVREEVGNIAKNHRLQGKGDYRSIDDTLDAFGPVFTKHGIFTTAETFDRKTTDSVEKNAKGEDRHIYHTTMKLRIHFWAKDGSSVFSDGEGEGLERGDDKSVNKATSYGYKNALLAGLSIPVKGAFVEGDATDNSDKPTNGNGHSDAPKPLSVLEQAKAAQAAEAARKAATREMLPNDPCTADQQQEILKLFQQLGKSPADLKDLLTKSKKEKLSEVSYASAIQLIAWLKGQLLKTGVTTEVQTVAHPGSSAALEAKGEKTPF